MIAKSYIHDSLKRLEVLYNKSPNKKTDLFYSKLAILELCGWIEDSMDDIISRCASKNLKEKSNKTYVLKEIIKKTYGFEYEKHFRNMLIRLIGLSYVEKVEQKVDSVKLQKLKATLSSLKDYRNKEAHTHLKGVTKRLDAPSATKNKFFIVYDGLKEFEEKIRRLRL